MAGYRCSTRNNHRANAFLLVLAVNGTLDHPGVEPDVAVPSAAAEDVAAAAQLEEMRKRLALDPSSDPGGGQYL